MIQSTLKKPDGDISNSVFFDQPHPAFAFHTHSNTPIVRACFDQVATNLVHQAHYKGLAWFRKKLKETPPDFQQYIEQNFAF